MSALVLNVFSDLKRSAKRILLKHLERCAECGGVLSFLVVRQDDTSMSILWLCQRCGRSYLRARGEVVGRYKTPYLRGRTASWKL
jgi:uncharacterized protein with PIN domain